MTDTDIQPRVKGLTWCKIHDDGSVVADTIFGEVTVYHSGDFGWLVIRDGHDDSWVKYPGRSGEGSFEKPADAMRFVEEYTERRILSALDLSPVTPAQAAEVLLAEGDERFSKPVQAMTRHLRNAGYLVPSMFVEAAIKAISEGE